MISTPLFHLPLAVQLAEQSKCMNGISQVLAAAVVNPQFRNALLNNPETALQSGYLGKAFSLTSSEKNRIVSINARSLTDLANQLAILNNKL
ncbi:MAG: hypothetical protein JXA13_14520 [Anaerolineales bacterium]|nr:hypothetical protein [Anaerolineales bacterium]